MATEDEGVFKVADGMYSGTSYYWRGAATTNHVIFANKCWRIVRINGDGSIRLIYNGALSGTAPNQTCPGNGSNSQNVVIASVDSYAGRYYATSSGAKNNSSYVGWTYTLNSQRPTLSKNANGLTVGGTESNAKVQTEKWFNNNSNFTDAQRAQVAIGKFCNDRNIGQGSYSAAGSDFYYGFYKRAYPSRRPTLSCPEGDVYELKVGAITTDEAMYAGGSFAGNTSYYLYSKESYWTMSPHSWSSTNSCAIMYTVSGGYLSNGCVDAVSGLRPVINLKADTTFSSGDGKQSSPYVVS